MNNFWSLFTTAVQNTSLIEWLAVITALLYIVLAAKKLIICWLFWIISSAFYIYICYTSLLLLETILNLFYLLTGFYGWWQWQKKSNVTISESALTLSSRNILLIVSGGVIFALILGYIFATYTKAFQPYFDAFITTFSIISTWMVAKQIIENWIFWIFINIASIILYANRELYLTAVLFIIYTMLSVYGFIQWKKSQRIVLSA